MSKNVLNPFPTEIRSQTRSVTVTPVSISYLFRAAVQTWWKLAWCLRQNCRERTQVKFCPSVFVSGPMWRLSTLVGVWSIRRGEEDPHHVSAEGAVRSRGGETPHRAPDRRGKRAEFRTRWPDPLNYAFVEQHTVCVHVSLVGFKIRLCFFSFLPSRLPRKRKLRLTQ